MNKKRLIAGSVLGLAAAGTAYALYRSKKDQTRVLPEISGFVAPGFEAVAEAFNENFSKRNELGGACCVYRNGEKNN